MHVVLLAAATGGGIGAAIGYARVGDRAAAVDLAPWVASPSRDEAVAVAEVEEPEFDFDSMQVGATRSHTFKVHNRGDAPLILTAGGTTCKCTSFEVSPQPIPPGGHGEAVVEWVAKTVPGSRFRQQATLNTNDPLRESIALVVSGEVVVASGLEPSQFAFGEIAAGDRAEASVVLYSTKLEDLQVDAKPPQSADGDPLYDVSVTPLPQADLPTARAKAGVRVTLTTNGSAPIGRITDWVVLTTNLPDQPTLEVPVSGRVQGQITVHGTGWTDESGVLRLGMVERTEGEKRRLLLSAKGEHAAQTRYEVAEVEPPELKVTLGEPKKRREEVYHTPLEIEVVPGTRPMVHLNTPQGDDGVVRLRTTHPQAKELVLRVRFAVVE